MVERGGPRWSKKTDELVRYVASRCRPRLQSELGRWLEDRPRFGSFVAANQDKIRKKLNGAGDEAARLDVRAELLVAYLILADRRFDLAFEAYGSGQRGPDLTVSYRANQRFNLEVTRLRPPAEVGTGHAEQEDGAGALRLASLMAAKVRQLPSDLPNGLVVIAGHVTGFSEATLAAATRLLKQRTDARDDAFFSRRGLASARDFYTRYVRLGGVFILDEASPGAAAVLAANRDARRALPAEAVARLTLCLRAADAVVGEHAAPSLPAANSGYPG